MAIVARNGATYCRLRFSAGPGGETMVPLTVDWERFPQDMLAEEGKMDERFIEWMDEYGRNIHHRTMPDLMPNQEATPAQQPLTHTDQMDALDELYDQQVLMDDFSSSFEESAVEEVYPWA